jgi:hypothetical protein
MLHQGSIKLHGHTLIWKIWAPLKVKIFFWLALKRRHWTADRRHRHGLDAQTICSLCGMEPETNDHLFLSCSYTRQVWAVTSHHIGGQWPNLLGIGTLEDWWLGARGLWSGPKKKGFDTLVALITWEVWKERNARVFRGDARHVDQLLQHIKAVADLWVQGGAVGLGCIMRE